jgi:hypothetical protein
VSQSQLRDILRYSHIVAAVVLGVIVYSPLIDNSGAVWLTRIVIVPFLVLGGVWMLMQSRAWAAGARAAGAPTAER